MFGTDKLDDLFAKLKSVLGEKKVKEYSLASYRSFGKINHALMNSRINA